MKKATLIYNPVAGGNPPKREREIRKAQEVLAQSGIVARLARTEAMGAGTELARAASCSGDDLLIVCGGDGTINEVINGISGIPLAILPGGTANIIAKELALPHHPVRAAHQLPSWTLRRIALGLATGLILSSSKAVQPVRRYFLSVAGVGLDAYVISRLGFDLKMSLGVAAYVFEGIKQLLRYSFPQVICRVNGREIEAPFAILQRTSRYAGWFRTAPGQSVIKPGLGVTLYKSSNPMSYVLYAAAAAAQFTAVGMERMEVREATFAARDGESRVYFELDGELAGMLPARFEVVHDALPLLAPQDGFDS